MIVDETSLPGVCIVNSKRFEDGRGFFSESWNRRALAENGIDVDFVQDNHSLSRRPGTIRGLHFQSPPHAQAKLVRCVRGQIYDVAVDVRKGSPTYGRWFGVELSSENGRQLFIPGGVLHGFMTLDADTEIAYKCSDYFAPECDGSVLWDSVGIDWPDLGVFPTLSDKDASAISFGSFESPFEWIEAP